MSNIVRASKRRRCKFEPEPYEERKHLKEAKQKKGKYMKHGDWRQVEGFEN